MQQYRNSHEVFLQLEGTSFLSMQSPLPLPDMTHIKVLLLGNSGVGKTSLAHRYLHGVYESILPATVSLLKQLTIVYTVATVTS